MFQTLLKSKIHRVALTHCELRYEGSCAIDENLLEAANIAQNEQIHIWTWKLPWLRVNIEKTFNNY